MSAPNRCDLDGDHCLSLEDILVAFNAPIGEEYAWAVCHQCAKCFKNNWQTASGRCAVVTDLSQVLIHKDGHVHPKTLVAPPGSPTGDESDPRPTEQTLVTGLGLVLFKALDFGLEEDEERHLSPELTALIQNMTGSGSGERPHQCETDDEGIERDSEEEHHNTATLSRVLQECTVHLGSGGAQEAESHYRAVCRALVAEALELSSFLERVTPPSNAVLATTPTSATQLANLNFNDWARLWVQVIRELRRGVQLKKVCYSRKPIEYELTPYEILMEDIRARRYQLRKVAPPRTHHIPHNLKKDAHAIILEFIRSRPPLRKRPINPSTTGTPTSQSYDKASDRKLAPPLTRSTTPREQLMESIKQGHVKLRSSPRTVETRLDDASILTATPDTTKSTRRLIKVDFSALPMDDDDDDDEEDTKSWVDRADRAEVVGKVVEDGSCPPKVSSDNRWQRTGSHRLSTAQIHEYFDTALQSYDLATQCPRADWTGGRRRSTLGVSNRGSRSVPQSRPDSRQTDTPTTEESIATTLPEMTWSRSSLQDDLLHSKQWQEECLSLTLEEIVHIRSVLTKAELESLPVEGHVKEDAEKRKVCFLCMKTRFGIFGPWGQICKLCKRTVCAKCYSKMRIPTEHFSHVPVVALSPNLLSPCDSEDSFPRALVTKLMSGSPPGSGTRGRGIMPQGSDSRHQPTKGPGGGSCGASGSVGSAPSSPSAHHRSAPTSHMSNSLISEGPISLPSSSPAYTTTSDKWRLAREKAIGRRGGGKAEKLKGLQMTVCHDCKTMVLQIIKSSRTTRNNAIRNLTLDLSPVY